MSKGVYFAFDGLDGTGKTTQAKRLVAYLKSTYGEVLLTREPGGSHIGPDVRRMILSDTYAIQPLTETLLLLADRYELQQNLILPAIRSGKMVIGDRTNDSTIAYQVFGKGIDRMLVLDFANKYLHRPHLTFLLKMSAENAVKRIGKRIRQTGEENKFDRYDTVFFQRVAEGYEFIAEAFADSISVIDADQSEEDVFRDIKKTADAFLQRHRL